ncbi:MAG TPA: OmpA family protein [Stellaceae bacterium]|nr:OmpA family protein [Stellaceae bacterium]
MLRSRAFSMAALGLAALTLAACWSKSPPQPQPVPQPPPAPMPPPVPGPQTMSERSVMTMAADLAFAKGSYTLTRAGKAKLNALVPALQAVQGKIVVYGYTDNARVGAALKKKGIVDNLDLSSRRADAVVRYLATQHVNPSIMSAKGRGETHPVAPNNTPAGRAQNRRIEVVVEQPAG